MIVNSFESESFIEVCGCFLIVDEHVLFLRRSEGIWAAPAGKVEAGESLQEAATREVFEESGVKLDDVTYIKPFYCVIDGRNVLYHQFVARLDERPEIILSVEHTEYCWKTPVEALKMKLIEDEDACIHEVFGVK